MKKLILTGLIVLCIGIICPTLIKAVPENTAVTHNQAIKSSDVVVSVKGIVCSFCAQGIKKAFAAKPGVKSVSVNLETKKVTLKLKPNTIVTDDDIRAVIKNTGYTVEDIYRK